MLLLLLLLLLINATHHYYYSSSKLLITTTIARHHYLSSLLLLLHSSPLLFITMTTHHCCYRQKHSCRAVHVADNQLVRVRFGFICTILWYCILFSVTVFCITFCHYSSSSFLITIYHHQLSTPFVILSAQLVLSVSFFARTLSATVRWTQQWNPNTVQYNYDQSGHIMGRIQQNRTWQQSIQ